MKYATSEHTTTRQSERTMQQDTSAGPNAISIAPPAYGIDFVDREPVEAVPEQGREYQSLVSVGGSAENRTISPGFIIQPKLIVVPAHDKYEQEADRMAQHVVRQISADSLPTPQDTSFRPDGNGGELQTKLFRFRADHEIKRAAQSIQSRQHQIGAEGGAVSGETESAIEQAKGSGQPLADSLRPKMERAFGANFYGVRVHTDSRADQLNQSIQAKAFTTGQHIFFKRGEYNPNSKRGQALLAHELTHVVQQKADVLNRQTGPQITKTSGHTHQINRKIKSITHTIGAAYKKTKFHIVKDYVVTVKVDEDTDVNNVKLERRVKAWSVKTGKEQRPSDWAKTTGKTKNTYDGAKCTLSGEMWERSPNPLSWGPWQADGPPEKSHVWPVKRDAKKGTIIVGDTPGIQGMGNLFTNPAEMHAKFQFNAYDLGNPGGVNILMDKADFTIGVNEFKGLVADEGPVVIPKKRKSLTKFEEPATKDKPQRRGSGL